MKKYSGRQKLEDLEASGEYLFHGSQFGDLDRLDPSITKGKAETTGGQIWNQNEAVVAATPFVDVAVFAALVWKRKGGKSGWYTNVDEKGKISFRFHADPVVIEAAKEDNGGYIYVLPRQGFVETSENPAEFVIRKPVVPIAVTEVSLADLRPGIDSLNSDPNRHR